MFAGAPFAAADGEAALSHIWVVQVESGQLFIDELISVPESYIHKNPIFRLMHPPPKKK